jgi:hypothetical protein
MKWISGLVTAAVLTLAANHSFAQYPGDFDWDGDVDGADFVVWQTNCPRPNNPIWPVDGDGDADGDCDGADFVIWQTNFPYTPSPATVPEPSTCALVLLSVPALFALRR